jgi:site-specific DNA-methyltransferase (adenine-specific)
MFAFTGETVLDPFLGSGTTSLAAKNLGRNSIGYEINPAYIETIKRKLNVHQTDIFGTQFEFFVDDFITDVESEIAKLPYRFIDSHKLDKKIDPKKLNFGSKIDGMNPENPVYYAVKEIISPELLRLNNDLIIRLIGVKENKERSAEAKMYLFQKTKGQRVFLKFDNIKYDKHNNLLCYLYLKNKTLINAHLIKENLVDPDLSSVYRYKQKFISQRRTDSAEYLD